MGVSASFRLRALTAFLLMLGFYALALGIAGFLLLLVYLDLASGHFHLRLVIFAPIVAGTILWAVYPRGEKFEPPGPELVPEEHPDLFAELGKIATATEQPMPSTVYLVPDVNAWVKQQGGALGIGGRRIMGLGLPLLYGLTRRQLLGVVAHEFGHYYGGDTKLGPVLYRTGRAIARTQEELSSSFFRFPFKLYGKLFLRITRATSRAQEFAADRLGANIAGTTAMIESLKVTPGLALAFPTFWETELVPSLRAGFRPPILSGFDIFAGQPEIVEMVGAACLEALADAKGNPYDSHPPLARRIEALERLEAVIPDGEDGPALELIGNLAGVEQRLLGHLYGEKAIDDLERVGWEELGSRAFLPRWMTVAEAEPDLLGDIHWSELPETLRDAEALESRIRHEIKGNLDKRKVDGYIDLVLSCGLAVALHRAGWTLEAEPGGGVRFEKDPMLIEPFAVIHALRENQMSARHWASLCAAAGLDPPATPKG